MSKRPRSEDNIEIKLEPIDVDSEDDDGMHVTVPHCPICTFAYDNRRHRRVICPRQTRGMADPCTHSICRDCYPRVFRGRCPGCRADFPNHPQGDVRPRPDTSGDRALAIALGDIQPVAVEPQPTERAPDVNLQMHNVISAYRRLDRYVSAPSPLQMFRPPTFRRFIDLVYRVGSTIQTLETAFLSWYASLIDRDSNDPNHSDLLLALFRDSFVICERTLLTVYEYVNDHRRHLPSEVRVYLIRLQESLFAVDQAMSARAND
jgi:hypothetical protein